MDYSLAKKLKDAGFKSNQQAWCEAYKDVLPVPTLEELIEACGPQFFSSLQRKNGGWQANSTCLLVDGIATYEKWIGSTPAEAVARLWLALQKTW